MTDRDASTSGGAFAGMTGPLLPLAIAVLSLLTLVHLGRLHTWGTYGTETDFYQYYAPDAERIAAWQMPKNTYQGPGYPAVLALLTLLTGDVFASAKWLSIVSAALVGMLVFALHSKLFGYAVGVGAQLIVLVSGAFPRFALSASTDVPFLLVCLAALVTLMSERSAAPRRVIVAAALAGLAYLIRYNGVLLPVVAVWGITALNLFGRAWRPRLKLATLFILVFCITVSPWLYLNYRHHGSPFYNTNYLNIAVHVYSDLAGGRVDQDGTRQLSTVFHSLGEVLRHDPQRMLARYLVNLYAIVKRILAGDLAGPWVAGLGLVGGALALIERRSPAVLFLLSAGVLYVLLMALAIWESRYYFFIAVILAGLAVHTMYRTLEWAHARGWLARRGVAVIAPSILAVVWIHLFTAAREDVTRFLADQPTEVIEACDYLKRMQVSRARILSRKPHLPYICGQQWIFFPVVTSVENLRRWLDTQPVDYVTFGWTERRFRRELAGLTDPKTAPPWLKPVWVRDHPPFVLYEVAPEVRACCR